jgi:hypothetical protein
MKIALCLSGHLRSYEQTWRALKTFILDPLSPDVFIHTWDTVGQSFHIDNHTTKQKTHQVLHKIQDIYKPKNIIIEPLIRLNGEKYRKYLIDDRCPNGVVNMFYKIHKTCLLCEDFSKSFDTTYDVIIRARPDLLFQTYINDQDLERAANDASLLFVPKNGHYGGINDQFAFGSSQAMNIYCNCYTNLDKIVTTTPLVPELVLKQQLINKVNIQLTDIRYLLLRVNRTFLDNSKMSPAPPDLG